PGWRGWRPTWLACSSSRRPRTGTPRRRPPEPSARPSSPSASGAAWAASAPRRRVAGAASTRAGASPTPSCSASRRRASCPGASGPEPRSLSPAEDGADGLLLHVGDEVAVAPAHLLGGVADPSIDQPLVHPLRGAVADEAVPQDVPAAQH